MELRNLLESLELGQHGPHQHSNSQEWFISRCFHIYNVSVLDLPTSIIGAVRGSATLPTRLSMICLTPLYCFLGFNLLFCITFLLDNRYSMYVIVLFCLISNWIFNIFRLFILHTIFIPHLILHYLQRYLPAFLHFYYVYIIYSCFMAIYGFFVKQFVLHVSYIKCIMSW